MASITTINSGDLITDSRAVINDNFANLNSDKIETSYLSTDTTLADNSDVKIPSQKAIKAYIDASGVLSVPTGSIITHGGITTPASFLPCNGAGVSRTTYDTLFGVIGTRYGVGNGSTTFNVPSLNLVDAERPTSYWKFDEISGNAYDSRGANTLLNNATTTYATGIIRNGADLEASSSQYFSITDALQTGLDITGDFSFSCWVKLESAPSSSQMVIASKWKAAGDQRGFSMFYKNNGGADFSLQLGVSSTGANQDVNGIAQTLTVGTWYHIVYVWTTATHSLQIYVNGSSIGTTTAISLTSIFNNSANFQIGHDDDGTADYFDGIIDEVGIWNGTLLSAANVTELYNGGVGKTNNGPDNYIIKT